MTRLLLVSASTISAAFALPEGFEIQEFTGPPNADYPAAITAAANGDVYVSSDQNRSLGKLDGMGRFNPLSPSWAGEAQRRPLSDPLNGDLKLLTSKANS